jgi:hypothetical protein
MLITKNSSPTPADKFLRVAGETCHSFSTILAPMGNICGVALPAAISALAKDFLPITIATDVLRCESSFMSDGCCIGEDTTHTGANILGELAGGFAGSGIGLTSGETIGATLGMILGGPLSAIAGSTIGGMIGSIGGSIGGSIVGANLSDHLTNRLWTD